MAHQVLTAQFDHIEVGVSVAAAICKHGSKHAIRVLGSEAEDEGPVKEPARLVQHAHRTLRKAIPYHVLNLTDRGEFCALTRLL